MLSLNFLIPRPAPPSKPVKRAPSVPNFNLFNNSVDGSYSVPSNPLSNSVGPPIKSPNVPASSTSPTKIPSATPPAPAPTPKLIALPFAFNSGSIFFLIPLARFLPELPVTLRYLPPFLAANAPLAKLLPALNATPPGIAKLVISSVILPAVVASAISSKGFIFAKYSSTSAALFVSAPRSISVAPRDTKPSGILKRPEPIPAKTDCIVLISFSSSPISFTLEFGSTIWNTIFAPY